MARKPRDVDFGIVILINFTHVSSYKLLKLTLSICFALLLSVVFTTSVKAVDYYVSPSGDDVNSGTSLETPWKTNAPINQTDFEPSDRILFEGGQIFVFSDAFGIRFTSEDAGTPTQPIVIGSYGEGRATLDGQGGATIVVNDMGGIEISNLNLVNGSGGEGVVVGISEDAILPEPVKYEHVYMDNLDISGFNRGILVWGKYGSGLKDVRITNVSAHDNNLNGIEVLALFTKTEIVYSHRDIYIGNNRVYNNRGGANSGSGIKVSGVENAVIERNEAFNNGETGGNSLGGPVGIWAFQCKNVIIQFNESHHNKTGVLVDGGGFDLDAGATFSVVQYNYSHDNEGPGYLAAEPKLGQPYHHNVFRYNISENDVRQNSGGAITLWQDGNGISDVEFYGNTIYITKNTTYRSTVAAVRLMSTTNNVSFRNNILIAKGGAPLILSKKSQTNINFQGNNYWTYGGRFSVKWLSPNYTSLTAWRTATGQESLNGTPTGTHVDPQITNPGAGGTIGDPNLLTTLTAYRLNSTSPLIDTGLNLPILFGVDPGLSDFFGNSIPMGGNFDVGANEFLN